DLQDFADHEVDRPAGRWDRAGWGQQRAIVRAFGSKFAHDALVGRHLVRDIDPEVGECAFEPLHEVHTPLAAMERLTEWNRNCLDILVYQLKDSIELVLAEQLVDPAGQHGIVLCGHGSAPLSTAPGWGCV